MILPVYNESENIFPLYTKLKELLERIEMEYELIFVDDGSVDDSLQRTLSLKKDKRVRIISFSRNFGHQAALMAGLDYANGDIIVMMDADLQHPPELIEKFLEKYKEGYDIVSTVRVETKKVSFFKKFTSFLFYLILRKISGLNIKPGMADFRLISRKVVDVLKNMPEREKFLRGLIQWIGFKEAIIEYVAEERIHGTSSYNLRKMMHFAINGITSFSAFPLRISGFLGFLIILICLPYAFYALYTKFFWQRRCERMGIIVAYHNVSWWLSIDKFGYNR